MAGGAGVDCTGRQVLVTGSTSGIGREAALALGRLGADVIVHGRDPEAGAAVVDDLANTRGSGEFLQADFADVEAVRSLAASVRSATDELDLLVNNAGGLFREGRLTAIGVEYTFHVNHLSPYLLTAELLDHLAPESRVVTTASAAHRATGLDLDRVTRPEGGSGAYGHSKLANVLFAAELARRLDAAGHAITSNSLHPGTIPGSGFTRFLPGPVSRVAGALGVVPGIASVAEGAAEILVPAVSPRTAEVTGRYFGDLQPTPPSDAAQDADAARRLWEHSATLLEIDEPLAEFGGPPPTGA
jgi:hypothetical protein